MNLIENYLNNLQTYLPEDIRSEVRDELEASIIGQLEDKQNELGRELNVSEVEDLLLSIGHPMRVAAAYQPNQQLIGSDYFPAYKKALELALVIVLGFKLLSNIPNLFAGENIIGIALHIIFAFIETGLWVFALITFIFYTLEKENVGLEQIYAWSRWDMKSLRSKIPLSRMQTLFEMTISLIFLGWWNNWLQWTILEAPSDVSPLLQFSPEWQGVFWSVNIIIGIAIAADFYKFIIGGWSKLTLNANILLNLATLLVLIQISRFDEYITVNETISASTLWDYNPLYMNISVLLILAVIAAITIFDTYKSITRLRGQ